jgi:RNA polymerase sigma-70 factor (ECF subfamily)
LPETETRARLEQALLPYLGDAYHLARWLTHDPHGAEDVVQEAFLRALKSFAGFRGTDGRAWLLAIVRNTFYTWLKEERGRQPVTAFDEVTESFEAEGMNPETLLLRKEDRQSVWRAVEELPAEFREVVILRDLKGLSYKEIAAVTAVPMGTVMSRLARGRERLYQRLSETVSSGRELVRGSFTKG